MKSRVSLVKCNSYSIEEVQSKVKKCFDLLGGICSFIKSGEKVLLKPNILSPRPPEDGVNTHPEVIRAVIRLVKHCGGVVRIADNPGGSVTPREVYAGSGIDAIAKEEGAELLEPKEVKRVKEIPIPNYIFESDKIISIPKMKTHSLTMITGAIKNMYGAVAGLYKTQCHKIFPSPKEFSMFLLDVFQVVKPHLVLMDGIVSMDGDGPSAGRLRDTSLLIAGQDAVSVDSVFSRLIGLNPSDVLTTKEAEKRGLGEANLENIEILGERLEDVLIKDFRLPGPKAKLINMLGPFAKVIAGLIKFRLCIDEETCKKCMICSKSCPVGCITVDSERSFIDSRHCIKCMCCHEVCPYGAVEIRRNFLAKRFGV